MRALVTVAGVRGGTPERVLIEADGSVRVDEVLPQLARAAAADGAGGPLAATVDGRFVSPVETLDELRLRDGSVVTVGPRGDLVVRESRPEDALVELRIVSGPDAGTVARAWRGALHIGSAPGAPLRIDDPYRVAASELAVEVEGAEDVRVRALVDGSSATLDGAPVTTTPTAWPVGGQIEIAGRLIELALPDLYAAALQPSADGSGLDYNRPPRILPPETATALRLPAPPAETPGRPLPIIAALTPLAMAGGSALLFHSYFFLLIAALSPMIMMITFFMDRRRGRTSKRKLQQEYREHKQIIETEAQEALVRERTELLRSSPDAAALAEIATRPTPRLWERRAADPDHLRLRLGTATQPSRVTLDDPEQLEHRRRVTWDARDVPAVVQLAERGVVGIAGWGDRPRRLAQWAVAQIAVLQSPRDVHLYLLTDSAGQAAWDWIGWLPHARPGFGQDTMATIGVSAATTARRIAELGALIDARRAAMGHGAGRWSGDEVVVVIDGARRLRSMPGFVQILKDGPGVGVYSLCVDSDERLLPEECTAVAIADHEKVVIRQQRVDMLSAIRPDLVDDGWVDRLSRAISAIRDASPEDDGGAIPTSSRLLDVLRLEPPTADAIEAGWLVAPRSTTAVIGESIDGPFSIDLRADGPHALIAGTTGSGKSELLQTLVATLAVANRPDEMNFVLVDYKGGAAFKDCVDLPHTVGMVTDLDAHLVERALESLGAELRTREHLLADAGAKDLEDYLDLRSRTPTLAAVARLVIVIDEFASLARELPDFVRGLVNIAQRGRSLGIHLVLATQRPSGVVSPEIRANTNMRIALRVTDTSESSDVIDAPDAGRISPQTPGRAYVRLGAASLVPFQTARVGGRRPGVSTGPSAPFVRSISFADLAEPEPAPPSEHGPAANADDTDLRALVAAVRSAAEAAGIRPQRRPWLPPLPSLLTIEQLWAEYPAPKPLIAYGLEDRPDEQVQRPAAIDLDEFGHLFVVGAPRSGRSQALRTLGAVLAAKVRAGDLHLYGVDCGNGALLPLAGFPHAGAIAQRHQTERVQRLLARLTGELSRRQALLAASGFASLPEQRVANPSAERMAHIVVLIDLWEGFVASLGNVDGGALVEQVQLLLREGASVGIHVVMSGDRQLLSGRISTFTEEKLVLRMTERSDYSLAGLNPRSMPEEIAAGRAFRAGSGVELQFAVLSLDTAGAAQAEALRTIAAQAVRRDAGLDDARRPFRVDVLPTDLTVADALQRTGPERDRRGWALLGVGGDELRGVGVDLLGEGSTFVVAGHRSRDAAPCSRRWRRR